MNEDLTIDEQIGVDQTQANDLEKQFLHPGYSWRGLSLRPYGVSTDLLCRQVLDRNDSPEFYFLSFIFIHVYDEERLIELCWKPIEFRKAVLSWAGSLGELTNDDYEKAAEIQKEMRNWARISSVEVIPDPTLPQKKTKATCQVQSPA